MLRPWGSGRAEPRRFRGKLGGGGERCCPSVRRRRRARMRKRGNHRPSRAVYLTAGFAMFLRSGVRARLSIGVAPTIQSAGPTKKSEGQRPLSRRKMTVLALRVRFLFGIDEQASERPQSSTRTRTNPADLAADEAGADFRVRQHRSGAPPIARRLPTGPLPRRLRLACRRVRRSAISSGALFRRSTPATSGLRDWTRETPMHLWLGRSHSVAGAQATDRTGAGARTRGRARCGKCEPSIR